MVQQLHLAVFNQGDKIRAIRYLDDAKPAIPEDQILLRITERIDRLDLSTWREFHERALRLALRYGLTQIEDTAPSFSIAS